ncbi:hypothetical protein V5799_006890 [Amblyomma americanum]|uniref:Uncharacterized protein n=1 Tax=Amblyomma americanum TaxID=6943 RepID=A0AAQ4DV38_AMBAM
MTSYRGKEREPPQYAAQAETTAFTDSRMREIFTLLLFLEGFFSSQRGAHYITRVRALESHQERATDQ